MPLGYPLNDFFKIYPSSVDATIVSIPRLMMLTFSLFTYTMNLGLVHKNLIILLIYWLWKLPKHNHQGILKSVHSHVWSLKAIAKRHFAKKVFVLSSKDNMTKAPAHHTVQIVWVITYFISQKVLLLIWVECNMNIHK